MVEAPLFNNHSLVDVTRAQKHVVKSKSASRRGSERTKETAAKRNLSSRANRTQARTREHAHSPYFEPGVRLFPMAGHPGSDYGYSHYLQRAE